MGEEETSFLPRRSSRWSQTRARWQRRSSRSPFRRCCRWSCWWRSWRWRWLQSPPEWGDAKWGGRHSQHREGSAKAAEDAEPKYQDLLNVHKKIDCQFCSPSGRHLCPPVEWPWLPLVVVGAPSPRSFHNQSWTSTDLLHKFKRNKYLLSSSNVFLDFGIKICFTQNV